MQNYVHRLLLDQSYTYTCLTRPAYVQLQMDSSLMCILTDLLVFRVLA
jgi:hypothetical protein